VCGRYELHSNPAAIALAFGLAHAPSVRPRYNVAPMQEVPIVRVSASGARELVAVRWGLVPRWAKDPAIGSKMINARGETVATKPSFRTAFRRHRCLIPANGFYEWMPAADGRKQPVLIAMKDGNVFAFAGLYERWLTGDGEPLDSCTILTTDANDLLRAVTGALSRRRFVPGSLLSDAPPKTPPGASGRPFAPASATTPASRELPTVSLFSNSLPTGTARASLLPAASPSALGRWRTPYERWVRRSPGWGPLTLA
jgi:putative SOS response-associated peptidase YedK